MSGRIEFDFEGRRIAASDGQSIAGALYAAGIRTLSWSAKYRRARGLRCGAGACPGCTMMVDGIGGIRTCETVATPGARVRRIRPRHLLLPADELGFLVPAGFQQARRLRSLRAWSLVEPVLARLAGQGALPTAAVDALPSVEAFHEIDVDLLVVGGGRKGLAAAEAGARAGKSVLLVDRGPRPGGRLLDRVGGAAEADALARRATDAGVRILAAATGLGAFDDGIAGVSAGRVLYAVRAADVIRATGTLDRDLSLPDGDRPGVLLPTAVERLVVRDVVLPGRAAVIVATADGAEQARSVAALLRSVGTAIAATCAPEDVRAIVGRTRVTGVRLAPGLVRCDLVVLCAGRRPAGELVRQGLLPEEPHVG